MRIDGTRVDGAVLVLLDGGLACVVRGGLSSPAVEIEEAQKLGPWTPAENSLPARRAMTVRLRQTRTAPLQSFRPVLHLQEAVPVASPADALEEPIADAATLKEASTAHQTAAQNEEIDIEGMQEEADDLAEEALAMSEEAETAEEHREASEALEAAAAAQEAIEKLQAPPVPEMGTPEFDAWLEQEVARRVAAGGDVAGVAVAPAPETLPPVVPVA